MKNAFLYFLATALTLTVASFSSSAQDWAKFGRLKEEQAWDDRSIGMVRMKDVRGSTYFTFRIISAKSPANKWWYRRKSTQGNNYMSALETAAKPEIEKIVQAGVMADIQMYKNMSS